MSNPETLTQRALNQLDDYNITAAETTINMGLSKWPTHLGLQTANSLLMLRQGLTEDAAELAIRLSKTEEMASGKVSEGVINVLSHVLQNTCCYAELAAVYERTVQLMGGPDSKDSTSAQENLLNAHILSGNLPVAQKMAMALQKKTGKHDFMIRGMMCNLAQVAEKDSDNMLLKISTKMIQSTFNANHCLQPQPTLMLVNLLLQQKLFDEAIQFVLSAHGKFLGLADKRYSTLIKCLDAKLAHIGEVAGGSAGACDEASSALRKRIAAVAKQGWSLDADNWTFAQRYLAMIDAGDASEGDASKVIPFADFPKPLWSDAATTFTAYGGEGWSYDDTAASSLKFIVDVQQTKTTGAKCLRGPFMAEIALLDKTLVAAGGDSAKKEALTQTIASKAVAYAAKFDGKGTCYLDLATLFCDDACPQALEAVIADLQKQEDAAVTKNSTIESDIIAIHRKRILKLKLWLLVTPISAAKISDATVEKFAATITECLAHYEACKPYSTSLEWSEEGKVDAYLLIIANVALRQWFYYRTAAVPAGAAEDSIEACTSPSAFTVVDAAAPSASSSSAFANPSMVGMANQSLITALSAFATMDRKKNNPGTLLFSTLFTQQLGVADIPSLDQLDFKGIQYSSMSPVAGQPLLRGCSFANVKSYFEHAYDRYFLFARKETANLRAKIFQHLSWPKMGELKGFEERLLRGIPRQEAIVFNAVCKLRDAQTIKYTQSQAVRFASVIEGALIAVSLPQRKELLGYGDAPVKAAFALSDLVDQTTKSIPITTLWKSILDKAGDGDIDESLPEDDDQFMMAFLFADLKSKNAKDLQSLLLDKDSRKWRRQQVVLAAIGALLLHDVAIFEAKKAAAANNAAPPSAAKSKNKFVPSAASAFANHPWASKEFLSVKYGLTSANIRKLSETIALRFSKASSASGGVSAASVAAAKTTIAVLAGMADVVAELVAAVDCYTTAPSTAAATLKNTAMNQNSPARKALAKILKEEVPTPSINSLADPSTASANGPDAVVAGAAFPLLFPMGIIMSSFLMLVPCPSDIATAFKDGLLRDVKEVVADRIAMCHSTVADCTSATALAEGDPATLRVTAALANAKALNLKSFASLVDDLLTDVNASSRRKV